MTDKARETGWPIVVGVLIFIIGIGELPPERIGEAGRYVVTGIYAWGIGVLFLLAYYFDHKSVLFRALIWFCEHLTFPPGRRMAFFYFALASSLGTVAILQGLGVINVARNP